jgi:hypothetical protein
MENRKPPRLSHFLLTFLTYWCTIQVCIGLVTGGLHQFFLIPVVIGELLVFGAGVALFLLTKHPLSLDLWQEWVMVKPRLAGAELLILGALSFAGCILLERLATLPMINYDSLWYHLPIMARWYQEGAFIRMEDFMRTGVWTTDQITFYPFNWEILCTLFAMPFQEDFLVALPNLIIWLVLGLSIYAVSCLIGATRVYSLAATALVLTTPLILQHINSLHVDLPFAAFFMTSTYFALSYHKTRSPSDVALFVISSGLLLGTKMSAVGYGILPVLVLLLLEIQAAVIDKRAPKLFNQPVRIAVPVLLFGAACCFLIGGFWYLKNWIEVGNPLGDVRVQVAGFSFPGSVSLSELRQTNLATLFSFTNVSHLKILVMQSLVRLQIPFVVLLLQMLLLPWVWFSKKRQIQIAPFLGILLLLVATVYLYWTTPMTATPLFPPGPVTSYIGQQIRFAMPCLALLGVVAATIATVMQTRLAIVVPIMLISSILGILSNTLFEILRTETAFKGGVGWTSKILDGFRTNPTAATEQVLTLAGSSLLDVIIYTVLYILIIILIAWAVWGRLHPAGLIASLSKLSQRSSQILLTALLIGLLTAATAVAREQRDLERHTIYQGVYDYIANQVGRDETIGYLLSYRSYFFYGKSLDQKVAYVPSRSSSLSDWVKDLKQQQIDLVAIGPLEEKMGWRERPEVQWLANSTEYFVPVFGKDPEKEPVFYRFKRS